MVSFIKVSFDHRFDLNSRSALVNKFAQPDKYVNQILNDSNPPTKRSAVDLGWTLRGLMLRNHPSMVKIIRVVLQFLRSGEPGVADQVKSF